MVLMMRDRPRDVMFYLHSSFLFSSFIDCIFVNFADFAFCFVLAVVLVSESGWLGWVSLIFFACFDFF